MDNKKLEKHLVFYEEADSVFYGKILFDKESKDLFYNAEYLGTYDKKLPLTDRVILSSEITRSWQLKDEDSIKVDYITLYKDTKNDIYNGRVSSIIWSLMDSTNLVDLKKIYKISLLDTLKLLYRDTKYLTKELLIDKFNVTTYPIKNTEGINKDIDLENVDRILLTMALYSVTETYPEMLDKLRK